MTLVHAAIVGAGPYGLSIAAHLRAANVSCEVLGQPMHTWRERMPAGMVLRSEPFASSLWDPRRRHTYARFCAERGEVYRPIGLPPSRERFLEYADWFRERAAGEVAGGMVGSIRRSNGLFALALEDGRKLAARNVILATGFMAFQRMPQALAALAPPFAVHSASMDTPGSYADLDVAVVGAGQSALEYAALLHEAGARVRILARASRIQWNGGPKPHRSLIDRMRSPYAGLGAGWKELAISELPQAFRALFAADKRHRYVRTSWGPSGAWWLRPRVDGLIDTLFSCEITGARVEQGRAVLDLRQDGTPSRMEVDRVIAGTGFEVDLQRLAYLDPTLASAIEREGATPRLDASYETSVPGLFVVGAASAPTFGPVMRFMFGAKHAAPSVARKLMRAA